METPKINTTSLFDYGYSLGLDTDQLIEVLLHEMPFAGQDELMEGLKAKAATLENSNVSE